MASREWRVLPADTRGVLRVDCGALLAGDAAAVVGDLLAGRGTEPALVAPLQRIGRWAAALGPRLLDGVVLLAHLRPAERGFLLVARGAAAAQIDTGAFAPAGDHGGHPLFVSHDARALAEAPDGDALWVARPGDDGLVSGSEEAVRAALDAAAGRAPSIETGAIGPYLETRAADATFAFVYGLPALYAPVATPGPGGSSLLRSRAVGGTLAFDADGFSGRLCVHTEDAQTFVERFAALAPEVDAGLSYVVPEASSGSGVGRVEVAIERVGWRRSPDEVRASRALAKKLFHGMNAVDAADAVRHGGKAPWMNFDVGGEPSSIFVNFEFADRAAVEAFEARELPAGFRLAPLRILEDEEPAYFLVLNAYQSSGGLVSGARAEWSVFVHDPRDGHPRFLVVQAAAANFSADPVHLLTHPEPVTHVLEQGAIVSRVGVRDTDDGPERPYFTSRIRWPQPREERVALAREFVAANDFIFWGHGVADRTLYNASMHNRDAVRIAAADVEVDDRSRWAPYLRPVPRHTYVYLEPLEIVISPWCNLDESHIDASDEHRRALVEFKDGFYPAMIRDIAAEGLRGEKHPLSSFTVAATPPSLEVHVPIVDPEGFAAVAPLPDGARLARLRILEGDAAGARPYLTLYVDRVEDAPEGIGARWATYVETEEGRPHLLVLDRVTEDVAVDPVRLLHLPGVVEHRAEGGVLRTRVESPDFRFASAIAWTTCAETLPSRELVEAGDRVAYVGGVWDKVYYDGGSMELPVRCAGPNVLAAGDLRTPWDAFLDPTAARAFVRDRVLHKACNPWRNVG